ncbi:hypothetical protein A9Q81_21950 [Gammaproteobacteria bacterium 42_54_T18]|nr:hypothetical protein A9Q81_21950 [Gammaproteobacteria bacterium 42_54_T18]
MNREIDLKQSHAVLAEKRKAGEGDMTTNSNYHFNCFSDEWTLGYQKNMIADVSFLHALPTSVQLDLRLALANICRWTACPYNYTSPLRLFLNLSNYNLSIEALQAYIIHVRKNNKTDGQVKCLKTVIDALALENIQYLPLLEYFKKVKFRKVQRSFFDSEKGSLSDAEHEALALALNKKRHLLFSNENKLTLCDIRRFICLRLTQATARRPVTLMQLKWCDISVEPHPIENNYHLRVPLGKQGGDAPFRSVFEDLPFPILPELYCELEVYRDRYWNDFLIHLNAQGIELTKIEKNTLLFSLPVLYDSSLFEALFSSKQALLSSVDQCSEAFHCTSQMIKDSVKVEFKSLTVSSDRVGRLNYSTNRQRDTVATRLGVSGSDKAIIARVLGQTTTRSVEPYVDMTTDMMRAINASVEGMQRLQHFFEGRLVESVSSGEIAIQGYLPGKGLDDVGVGTSGCNHCSQERPLHCYGCPSFRPIKTADHRSVYSDALSCYDQKIRGGVTENGLVALRNAIKAVAITIKACDDVLARPYVLEGAEL